MSKAHDDRNGLEEQDKGGDEMRHREQAGERCVVLVMNGPPGINQLQGGRLTDERQRKPGGETPEAPRHCAAEYQAGHARGDRQTGGSLKIAFAISKSRMTQGHDEQGESDNPEHDPPESCQAGVPTVRSPVIRYPTRVIRPSLLTSRSS